jgi:hypothetical protein
MEKDRIGVCATSEGKTEHQIKIYLLTEQHCTLTK